MKISPGRTPLPRQLPGKRGLGAFPAAEPAKGRGRRQRHPAPSSSLRMPPSQAPRCPDGQGRCFSCGFSFLASWVRWSPRCTRARGTLLRGRVGNVAQLRAPLAFSRRKPPGAPGRPETRVPRALREGGPGGSTASSGDYRLRASSPHREGRGLPAYPSPHPPNPSPGPGRWGRVCRSGGFRRRWGRLRLSGGPVLPQDPPRPYTQLRRKVKQERRAPRTLGEPGPPKVLLGCAKVRVR